MIDPFAPAHVIAQRVRVGEVAAIEIAEAALARIQAVDASLLAFTDVTAERARAEAREIDRKRRAGEALGPLAGAPYAVKNLFDISGLPTRAGSKINRERAPAARDAVLIERMTAGGGVLLGGLNMGEYAYDFTGENAHDGNCRNPHDLSRMSGGSSSGSGAAAAAGLATLTLGSDTNGSIRVPSSFCGLFGLKPTYGRLPRTRSFPFCDSLDHLGPIARNVRDLALAYDVLQGHDPHDPVCAPGAIELTASEIAKGAEGLRIGVAGGYFNTDGLPEAAGAVAAAAKALGASEVVDLRGAAEARAAAFLITNGESSALHLERLRTRVMDFDPDTRDRFLAGAFVPAVWMVQAQRVRRWFHDEMLKVFESFDVIIAPATPCVAPKSGDRIMTFRGEDIMVRPNIGVFTQPISCIGFPVVAAPTFGAAMPIGVQLIAAPWREDLCLRAAQTLEQSGVSRIIHPALPQG